jgi:hypothetical protein
MVESDVQQYLSAIATHYDKWWRLYTLSEAEGTQAQGKGQFFKFGLMIIGANLYQIWYNGQLWNEIPPYKLLSIARPLDESL